MGEKLFVPDESFITVEDLERFPIWMNAHEFDEDEFHARFNYWPNECSRVAYEGSYPYVLPINEQDLKKAGSILVRCQYSFAHGNTAIGTIEPARRDRYTREYELTNPTLVLKGPHQALNLQIGDLSRLSEEMRHRVLGQIKSKFETYIGKLSEAFPAEATISNGLLSPNVPHSVTIKGITYNIGAQIFMLG